MHYRLRNYQREFINWAESKPKCAYFDDTGLGKTLAVLTLMRETDTFPLLWVTLASLRINVQKEFEKWFYPDFCFVCNSSKDLENWNGKGILVVSYQFFLKAANRDALKRFGKWKGMVCDETHKFLRNWDSQTCKNVLLEFATRMRRVVLMTATPYVRSALDLHPILSICEPGKWGKVRGFGNTYCNVEKDPFGNPISGTWSGLKQNKAEELKTALQRISIRRRRHEVEKELPEVIIADVWLQHGTHDDAAMQIDYSEGSRLLQLQSAKWEEKHKELGILKIPLVFEWLIDEDPVPTIVFTWHRDVAQGIYNRLLESGSKAGLIIGGIPDRNRYEIIAQFQRGDLGFIVANMGAMGEGFNVNACERVVFAERYWSGSVEHQALGRAVRLDTDHKVFSYKIMVPGSLDEVIHNVVDRKIKDSGAVGIAI